MRAKLSPTRKSALLVLAGLVTVLALLEVATMRSLTPRPAAGPVAQAPLVRPENETAMQTGLTPDEYMDLKQSSAQPVTTAQVERMQAQAAAVPEAPNPTAWQLVGPANVGARITDVQVDYTTPDAVFAAVSGGGIWRSTDKGINWTSIWPDSNVQTMGAFAQAPDGTLWAGTGEANPPGGGLTYFGDGIYKSTDGGANWQNTGLRDSASIGRIAVDPSNANRVFAAAAGHVARSVPQRGLYRTTDGGGSWKLVLAPPNATTGAIDVAIDPVNPQRVFASLWDHKRNNGARTYGGIGSGLFRSDDGGDTWTRLENITGPLPVEDQPTDGGGAGRGAIANGSNAVTITSTTSGSFQLGHQLVGTGIPARTTITAVNGNTLTISANATATNANAALTDFRPPTGLKADVSLGRIGVAIAPSNHNRVYVVSGSPYGPDKGFLVSDDGGDSFRAGGRAYANSGYQWWFGRIWVDPANQDHIFNADVGLRVSNDAGTTWTNSSGPHADHHGMDWDTRVPNRVYLGNDGGMYRSDQNGNSGTWTHASYEPWNQSYHVGVSQQHANRLVTGLQDNGSVRSWTATNPDPTDLTQFNSYNGGDGHNVLIDPKDETTYYACFQPSPPNQSCSGFHDTGTTTQSWGFPNNGAGAPWAAANRPGQLPFRWTTDTPIVIDPTDSNVVYIGGQALARSTNQGRAFTLISPTDDATSLPGPVPPDENDLGPFYANEYATISAIAPTKTDPNTIYVGTDTGRMWKTTDLGAHWTRLTGTPERWVNAIKVDPADGNHAYAAFSGYREGDESASVYETKDGGTTWTNISGNLPNGPVEMIEYDDVHDVLYAATDVGAFDHKDGDQYWYKISGSLPNVPVLDVKLNGPKTELYAATFGRSIWRLPLTTSVSTGAGGGPGGTVPATLSLTLGPAASFGAFTPGATKDYSAQTTANVVSTAGDAALSVSDPGHLMNGTFALPSALVVELSKAAWTGPVSNDLVNVGFTQHIDANDALRTGSYSKTLTFTLSTTSP